LLGFIPVGIAQRLGLEDQLIAARAKQIPAAKLCQRE
jgi:hypothetical protein